LPVNQVYIYLILSRTRKTGLTMDNVEILTKTSIGKNFIPADFLPQGKDEYHIRNRQSPPGRSLFRSLRAGEIDSLVRNNNTSDNWNDVLVSEEFDPDLLRDNDFFGLIRIGRLRKVILQHHDIRVPAGISRSRIISCDIGNDTAIHNVRYLSHFIINDRCILLNIDEMHTSNHSKFGNGIIKEGEKEDVRVWMELMNECGGRRVLAFDGMIAADAYVWAKYRDDAVLLEKLKEITQRKFDSRRGYYGIAGTQCVIKNSRIIKDTNIGDHAYIKGANKIKNVTINSSSAEPTQIGEGVELVNGIIGYGCKIFYGCKAVRFIVSNNSNLKYGARLINSFLGDNSTISCCEVLNNLIFPAHEQHHNNSFLISSLVMGQSNIAAGATIGSNHNTRSNDNEMSAGRGFWPGLCTSIRHPSRFASFALLARSDFSYELDIPLPFSLINNNVAKNQLEIVPAFWWLHDMYALARNSWKFAFRDKRKNKTQHIEFDPLAPDTVEEIITACRLLEIWAGSAVLKSAGKMDGGSDERVCAKTGLEHLRSSSQKSADPVEILGERIEKSTRKTVILSAQKGYCAYQDMLFYYAVSNVLDFLQSYKNATFDSMCRDLAGPRVSAWTNLGGQIMATADADRLRADIRSGGLESWDAIHARYDRLFETYPLEKQKHAFSVLCMLLGTDTITKTQWTAALDTAARIQDFRRDQVYRSRKKDDDNPFRQSLFRNAEEMKAVVGCADDDAFIKQIRTETDAFHKAIEDIKKRP
jgi:hypothetical protein